MLLRPDTTMRSSIGTQRVHMMQEMGGHGVMSSEALETQCRPWADTVERDELRLASRFCSIELLPGMAGCGNRNYPRIMAQPAKMVFLRFCLIYWMAGFFSQYWAESSIRCRCISIQRLSTKGNQLETSASLSVRFEDLPSRFRGWRNAETAELCLSRRANLKRLSISIEKSRKGEAEL